MFLFLAQAATESAYEIDIVEQMLGSRGVVLFVLLVLIGMSITTWFIIGYKWVFFRRVEQESKAFMKAYWDDKRWEALKERSEVLIHSPVARMFQACYGELVRIRNKARDKTGGMQFTHEDMMENIQRQLNRTMSAESERLERFVSFLGTTGASAPFIGLFGTVWGIMKAFAHINPNRPVLETVTPHIAQALIATAIGLFAAIPAVIAYNFFISRIKGATTRMDNFGQDFLNDISRMDIGDRRS